MFVWTPHFGTRSAVPFDAAPKLQSLKVKFSFESWTFVIFSLLLLHLLNGLKMQEMAVLGGLDFKISRGNMPPDPPSSSRLPTLGALNFLGLSERTLRDETLTKAWQMLKFYSHLMDSNFTFSPGGAFPRTPPCRPTVGQWALAKNPSEPPQ